MSEDPQIRLLTRIAEALERLAPPEPAALDLSRAEVFVWRAETMTPAPAA